MTLVVAGLHDPSTPECGLDADPTAGCTHIDAALPLAQARRSTLSRRGSRRVGRCWTVDVPCLLYVLVSYWVKRERRRGLWRVEGVRAWVFWNDGIYRLVQFGQAIAWTPDAVRVQ